jgi:hypothetical protein
MTTKLLQSEPDISLSVSSFWDRLRDTASWCVARASLNDPRGSMRSSMSQPRVLEPSYFDTVRAVVNLRIGKRLQIVQEPLTACRLLVYFPDAELADGAAEQETGGFFDVNNAPPWDTWVGFFHDSSAPDSSYARYLVAWIPDLFVPVAQKGIDVNPEGCIEWLDDSAVVLRDVISVALRGA